MSHAQALAFSCSRSCHAHALPEHGAEDVAKSDVSCRLPYIAEPPTTSALGAACMGDGEGDGGAGCWAGGGHAGCVSEETVALWRPAALAELGTEGVAKSVVSIGSTGMAEPPTTSASGSARLGDSGRGGGGAFTGNARCCCCGRSDCVSKHTGGLLTCSRCCCCCALWVNSAPMHIR